MTDPKSEWVCRACEETECHFSVNAKLVNATMKPVRCPMYWGNPHASVDDWERIV